MPAYGPGDTPPGAAVKAAKRLKKRSPSPAPTPTQIKSAKAQEQAFASQGKAVEKDANRQRAVRKQRVTRAQEKTYASQGKAVESAANDQAAKAAFLKKHPELKESAKKYPQFFESKKNLQKAGFTPDVVGQVAGNVFKDLIEIGQTPASLYKVGETAATGHPLRAAKMVGEPYVEIAKHPVKSLKEHPLLTPLTVAGPKTLIGRGTGAIARTGALGKTLKAAASTERIVKNVPGTSLTQTEKYSPDVITKARQVGVEKVKQARARRVEAMGGQEVTPRARMSEREIQKRVDERIALNEDVRRANRAKVIYEASQALKHNEHPATSLIAQGIVKPHRVDLRRYISELEAEHANLRPADKFANKKLRQELQHVVDNPKVDLERAQQAGQRYAKIIEARQPSLIEHGMLTEEQSLRAKMIPYAVRHMEAKHENGALVTAEGHPLSTDTILEHYKLNHSGELPAFVTHRPRRRGNFNIRSESAPNIGVGTRTGRATKAGLMDVSHGALVENAARVQGLRDAAEGFNGIVKEFGVKTGDKVTQFKTRASAVDAARNLRFDEHGNPLPGTHNMVPIRLAPFHGQQLESLIEHTSGDEMVGVHSPIREAIQSALKGTEGEGPWGLIPEAAAKRIQQHMNTMGATTFEQAFQASTGVFRKTVLSTSPTWLWGNVSEAIIRSLIDRAGPGSYVYARRVLNDLQRTSPELAQEVAHRVAGGGHFSTAERMQIFRSADQFTGTSLEPVANSLARVVRAPGASNVANAWHQWTTHVFRFNSYLERQFQTAMFGRALKREGYKAVEDAARGLKNTEAQVRFGRMVDDAYGKYSKWSPSTRRLIAGYTPFISWWLAATKFVFRVLPRDHPVVTSLMASSVTATRDWREKEKITLPQLGLKAGFLAGDIPLSHGRHVNIARYTPFGAFTNPADVANTVLPQFATLANAAQGRDWKGHEYKTLKAGIEGAGSELAGAYVPFFSRFEAAKKYGAGPSLNPYRPIAPGKKTSAAWESHRGPVKIPLGGGSTGHKIPLDGSSGSHKIKLG
jgi:hypothetical protein